MTASMDLSICASALSMLLRILRISTMLRGLHGRAALTESIQILGRGIDLRFLARHLRFESLQSRWDIIPAGRDRDAMARYPLWRGSHPRLRPQSWRRCYALQDVAFPQGYTPAPHELAAWTEAQ